MWSCPFVTVSRLPSNLPHISTVVPYPCFVTRRHLWHSVIGWELEGKLTSLTGHLIGCGLSNDDIICMVYVVQGSYSNVLLYYMHCRSCVKLYFIGQPILPNVVLSRALSLVQEQRHTGLSLLFPCTIVNHSLTLEKYRRATNPKLSCLNWLVVVKWNQLHGLPSWAKNTKATFWDVQEDSQEDNPDVIGVKREKALVESNLSRPHLSGFSRAAEQQNESPRVKIEREEINRLARY